MATYLELRNLFNDGDLSNRVDVATMVAANDLIAGTPTVDEQSWAAYVFDSPRNEGRKALNAVLAENKDASVAAIQGATDAAIQAQVDVLVPSLVIAHTALGV